MILADGRKSAAKKKRKKKPDIVIDTADAKDMTAGAPAGEDASSTASGPPPPRGEGKRQRDERGRFVNGHDRPEGAGFQPGNLESSKYDAKYPEDMKIYFRQISDEGNYPTFEGYADSIGVTARTLENWCEAHPLFKDAYDFCKNKQRGALLEGAMAGRFNATFAKFVAVNCHGMKEKIENDVKGSGGFNISVGYFEGEEDK